MRDYITTFRDITFEAELFARLTDRMLSDCGRYFHFRGDLRQIDTVILGNAPKAARLADPPKHKNELQWKEFPLLGDVVEQYERLEYEPEHFWGVYRRIADKFLDTFENLSLDKLSFAPWRLEKFVTGIWSEFFLMEVENFIAVDRRFPILVLRTVSYPGEYLDSTNDLERIVMRWYRIDFD